MNRRTKWMACAIAVAAVAVLSPIAIGAAGADATSAVPSCSPVPPPSTQTSQCQFLAYTTGYGWWDNTPPGSSTISYPVIHQTAGGTGTFADPITLAVGHEIVNGEDIPEFTPGTIWYIPNFRRYFIVEDSCGDGNDPQNEACWDLNGDTADGSAPPGAQVWLDLWTDGSQVSQSTSNWCESAITDNHVAIMNPADDYAVVAGSIDGASGCTQQYGDTLVTATPPPTTTSTSTTPPPAAVTPTTTLRPTTASKPASKKHQKRKLAKRHQQRKLAKKRKAAKAQRGRRGRRRR
jgi:hypothetical protein